MLPTRFGCGQLCKACDVLGSSLQTDFTGLKSGEAMRNSDTFGVTIFAQTGKACNNVEGPYFGMLSEVPFSDFHVYQVTESIDYVRSRRSICRPAGVI